MTVSDMGKSVEEMRYLMYKGRRSGINSGTALIIWGTIALIAMELTPHFFQSGWFRSNTIAVIVTITFHLLLFTSGTVLDKILTRKKIEELDEILDYTQEQVIKIIVFMLGLGTYLTVILATHGVNDFIYPLWMILIGIGIYFCGLFSLKYYERYGLLLIVTGVLATFIPEPYIYIAGKRLSEVMLGAGLIVSGAYIKRKYGW